MRIFLNLMLIIGLPFNAHGAFPSGSYYSNSPPDTSYSPPSLSTPSYDYSYSGPTTETSYSYSSQPSQPPSLSAESNPSIPNQSISYPGLAPQYSNPPSPRPSQSFIPGLPNNTSNSSGSPYYSSSGYGTSKGTATESEKSTQSATVRSTATARKYSRVNVESSVVSSGVITEIAKSGNFTGQGQASHSGTVKKIATGSIQVMQGATVTARSTVTSKATVSTWIGSYDSPSVRQDKANKAAHAAASSVAKAHAKTAAGKAAREKAQSQSEEAAKKKAEELADKRSREIVEAKGKHDVELEAARIVRSYAQHEAAVAANKQLQLKLNASGEYLVWVKTEEKKAGSLPYPLGLNHSIDFWTKQPPEKFWKAQNIENMPDLQAKLSVTAKVFGLAPQTAAALKSKVESVQNEHYAAPLLFDEQVAAAATQYQMLRGATLKRFTYANLPPEILSALAIPNNVVPGVRSVATIAAIGLLKTPVFYTNDFVWNSFVKEQYNQTYGATEAPVGSKPVAATMFGKIGDDDVRLGYGFVVMSPGAQDSPTLMHEAFHAGLGYLKAQGYDHANQYITDFSTDFHSPDEHDGIYDNYNRLQNTLEDAVPNFRSMGFNQLGPDHYFNNGEELAAHIFTGAIMSTLVQLGAIKTTPQGAAKFKENTQTLVMTLGRSLGVDMSNPLYQSIETPTIIGAMSGWAMTEAKLLNSLEELAEAADEEALATLPLGTNPISGKTPKAFLEDLKKHLMENRKK